MSDDLSARVAAEVREVHEFIEAWIRGEAANDDAIWARDFAWRFASDFAWIAPSGELFGPDRALPTVRGLHGKNPELVLRVRDAVAIRGDEATVVARYVEWQQPDPRTTTERWSTVVFEVRQGRLIWRWLQETWIRPPTTG